MAVFYEVNNVPAHSVLQMRTREQALTYPKGTIRLGFCSNCSFISNIAFDPSLHDYSPEYEATQSYSPTFNKFNTQLAQHLIDQYDLHEKTVIEIGCGDGEFLILLSELGPNSGVGFDPAYRDERIQHPAKERIRFIQDFYSEKYADVHGDFVVCKMTLEHIPNTAEFLTTVRRSIGDRIGTRVFFQIPNAGYVFRDIAFWDIYYEHCSYFSKAALAALFLRTGFEIVDISTGYDDQYLMIEATAGASTTDFKQSIVAFVEEAVQDRAFFAEHIDERLSGWRKLIAGLHDGQKKTVIWGSGSKGVTFLNTLGISDEIEYVVDINPNRWGTFMAGSGHEIVGPNFLNAYQPDAVIVMNPIYIPEIQANLRKMDLFPQLLSTNSLERVH
jgi:2-polyprenyl-3-methyl-5-hydroxy-6-metoxy-1,4-benzoquinol methylase